MLCHFHKFDPINNGIINFKLKTLITFIIKNLESSKLINLIGLFDDIKFNSIYVIF